MHLSGLVMTRKFLHVEETLPDLFFCSTPRFSSGDVIFHSLSKQVYLHKIDNEGLSMDHLSMLPQTDIRWEGGWY